MSRSRVVFGLAHLFLAVSVVACDGEMADDKAPVPAGVAEASQTPQADPGLTASAMPGAAAEGAAGDSPALDEGISLQRYCGWTGFMTWPQFVNGTAVNGFTNPAVKHDPAFGPYYEVPRWSIQRHIYGSFIFGLQILGYAPGAAVIVTMIPQGAPAGRLAATFRYAVADFQAPHGVYNGLQWVSSWPGVYYSGPQVFADQLANGFYIVDAQMGMIMNAPRCTGSFRVKIVP